MELTGIDLGQLGDNQLLWIDLTRDDLARIDLFPPEIAKALEESADVRTLEISGDHYRFGLSALGTETHGLLFVVGKSWLVTLSGSRHEFLDEYVASDRGETLKGKMTPTALASSLLLRLLEEFRVELETVNTAIDTLDEEILRSREKRKPLHRLAALRRRVAGIRTSLAEQRGVITNLVAPDFLAHVAKGDHEHLLLVHQSFQRMEDDVSRARDVVVGSFELYASRVAQDTNQLLKALTIATVITGIIGAVAGVFGMNFVTPMRDWGLNGFLGVVGGMLVMSATVLAIALWRRWI